MQAQQAHVTEATTPRSGQPERMPVLFVGHGSPMNAIEDNEWARGFAALGELVPRPKAIVSVSAHWYVPGTWVTGNDRPRTIHDFGGFPQPLYEVQYPARGHADLAARIAAGLPEGPDAVKTDWGLDHGTWSVLRRMFPEADVPVIQLSIDRRAAPARHLEIGRALADLREQGVLILGSGNLTHNLRDAFGRMRSGDQTPVEWAQRFDADVVEAIAHHDGTRLAQLLTSDDGRRSHPTPDHYLPLLYAFGASDDRDAATYPIEGFSFGSLSMRSVCLGVR